MNETQERLTRLTALAYACASSTRDDLPRERKRRTIGAYLRNVAAAGIATDVDGLGDQKLRERAAAGMREHAHDLYRTAATSPACARAVGRCCTEAQETYEKLTAGGPGAEAGTQLVTWWKNAGPNMSAAWSTLTKATANCASMHPELLARHAEQRCKAVDATIAELTEELPEIGARLIERNEAPPEPEDLVGTVNALNELDRLWQANALRSIAREFNACGANPDREPGPGHAISAAEMVTAQTKWEEHTSAQGARVARNAVLAVGEVVHHVPQHSAEENRKRTPERIPRRSDANNRKRGR